MTHKQIQEWLDGIMYRLDAPEVYLGDEPNTFHRDWDSVDGVRLCLVNSQTYTLSSGNMAIPLLYGIINAEGKHICERSYFPDRRMMRWMEKGKIPLFAWESKRPITEFDVIGFSSCYPGAFFHIPKMLFMSGIPVYSGNREEGHPIIIHGGAHSFNVEPIADIIDVNFVGEAEDTLRWALDKIKECMDDGLERNEILYELALCPHHGIYVPQFYDMEYSEDGGEISSISPNMEGVPFPVRKGVVASLDDTPTVPRLLVPSTGDHMMLGQVEIARGCNAHCRFCQEGITYKPYRERSLHQNLELFREAMVWTGAATLLPYCFNTNAYSQKNALFSTLLGEVYDNVKQISQRVREFAADDGSYARLSCLAGDKSITFGIEGASQRLRNVVNKGITEDEILRAFRYACRAGYKMVKLFLISNLPTETDKDRREFPKLLEKMIQVSEEEGVGTKIRCSWTPFFSQCFTPFQFAHASGVGVRVLDEVFLEIKKLGIHGRISTKGRDDWIIQLLHRGDRRLCPWIVESSVTLRADHLGRFRPEVTSLLEKRYFPVWGVGWDYWFDERGFDYIFPWEHIDVGVSKEWLWGEWEKSKRGLTSGLCLQREKGCGECGACKLIPKHMHEIYRMRKLDRYDSGVDLKDVNIIRQKGSVATVRVEGFIDEKHRWLPREFWKLVLRRSSRIVNLPASRDVQLASDGVKIFDWCYGSFVFDYKLYTKIPRDEVDLRMLEMEDYLVPWLHLIRHRYWRRVLRKPRNVGNLALYIIPTDSSIRGQDEIEEGVEALLASTTFEVVFREYGVAKHEIVRSVRDVRADVRDAWTLVDEYTERVFLCMLISSLINPYDIFREMYGSPWRTGVRQPVLRFGYFSAVDDSQDDFLRPRCKVCGRNIEHDMFDERVNDEVCLKHIGYRILDDARERLGSEIFAKELGLLSV